MTFRSTKATTDTPVPVARGAEARNTKQKVLAEAYEAELPSEPPALPPRRKSSRWGSLLVVPHPELSSEKGNWVRCLPSRTQSQLLAGYDFSRGGHPATFRQSCTQSSPSSLRNKRGRERKTPQPHVSSCEGRRRNPLTASTPLTSDLQPGVLGKTHSLTHSLTQSGCIFRTRCD